MAFFARALGASARTAPRRYVFGGAGQAAALSALPAPSVLFRKRPVLCFSIRSRAAGSVAAMRSPSSMPGLRDVDDKEIEALVAAGRPVVLHCGARWSPESSAAKARLSEWAATSSGAEAEVLCAAADFATAPTFLSQQHVRVVPSVLLFSAGRLERRADGANEADLQRLLADADKYRLMQDDSSAVAVADVESESHLNPLTPEALLLLAEDDSKRAGGVWTARACDLCRQALRAGPSVHDFRARFLVLRCLVQAAEAAAASANACAPPDAEVSDLEKAVDELYAMHWEELRGENREALLVAQVLAHAGLLLEAWTERSPVVLKDVGETSSSRLAREESLRHYAAGRYEEAVNAAIRSYKQSACDDIQGLAIAYAQPDRPLHIDDRMRAIDSIYGKGDLKLDAASPPGPALQRVFLQRLFLALGPSHPVVERARADLALLLDRKEHVAFHTRWTKTRKGGGPRKARGTGKRSGYSKFYWVAWEPFRVRRNTKRMGSPHCDKGD